MRKKIVVLGMVLRFLLLSSLVYAQSQDKNDSIQQSVDAWSFGTNSAMFACPRYLLRWSMELYKAGAKEDAIKIAEVAKNNAELAGKDISKYSASLPQSLPQIKQKMINYTGVMAQAADEYIKYFKTGDKNIIDTIDKYMNEASGYDKDIEVLLKQPLDRVDNAIADAHVMCPRWFSTWSESYRGDVGLTLQEERGYSKDVIACDDCAGIMMGANAINEIFEKEVMNSVKDSKIKEKQLAYIKAIKNMNDAYIELYKTGDKKLSETPYEYQNEALAIEKEINEYLSSTQQQQK
jgi:hypothetical protein